DVPGPHGLPGRPLGQPARGRAGRGRPPAAVRGPLRARPGRGPARLATHAADAHRHDLARDRDGGRRAALRLRPGRAGAGDGEARAGARFWRGHPKRDVACDNCTVTVAERASLPRPRWVGPALAGAVLVVAALTLLLNDCRCDQARSSARLAAVTLIVLAWAV